MQPRIVYLLAKGLSASTVNLRLDGFALYTTRARGTCKRGVQHQVSRIVGEGKDDLRIEKPDLTRRSMPASLSFGENARMSEPSVTRWLEGSLHFDREVELLQDLTYSRQKLEKALLSLDTPLAFHQQPGKA